jgi:predicted nucleic acid-binding protein
MGRGVSRETLLLDACLAITFGTADRLALLTELQRYRVAIPPHALGEVRRPPASDRLRQAIQEGHISVESLNLDLVEERDALAQFDARPAFRGRGEAEVLALAQIRGYLVGSDERAVASVVREEFGAGRIAGTLDILIWAVREQRLGAAEAEHLLRHLDTGLGILKALKRSGTRLQHLI